MHSIFKLGHNCQQVETATYASVLVDYANYYHALYETINNARHSIFVLGWDIDSRIKLLRGREFRGKRNYSEFFSLIHQKAIQNPNLMIYLNRWDYSIYMAAEREGFAKYKWMYKAPKNVHYALDYIIPIGGCHHQKIVAIDDEVAFCGGMDVALGRWDVREHHPRSRHRIDPEGTYKPGCKKFGPYHDVQMMVAGPAARALAEIARRRWQQATNGHAVPIRPLLESSLPICWPQSVAVDFKNVPTAIALTLPKLNGKPAVRQIEQLYLDQINKAEKFIYIENQYLTHIPLAAALNARLKERSELRVLLVSSSDPKGIFERKAMWYGRVLFRDMLESGGVKERILMASPISRENGIEEPVHIHSKVMITDDSYLRIGSSNLNSRSMGFDTECDLVVEANHETTRQKIAVVRNDLIREHTGREVANIEKLITSGANVEEFLKYLSYSRQHLRKLNNEIYRFEAFGDFVLRLSDPEEPPLPDKLSQVYIKFKQRYFKFLVAVILLVGAIGYLWQEAPLLHYMSPELVAPLFERIRSSIWAVPLAIGIYMVGTLLFIPHGIMSAATVIVFAPVQALFVAMLGSLVSGAIGFAVGYLFGINSLRFLIGKYADMLSGYAGKGGVLGMTLLRMTPIAPFTVVNLALGMLKTPFFIFMAGTFLGLLPGTVALAYLGHSLVSLWQNPDRESIVQVSAGVVVWACIVIAAHFAGRHWKQRINASNA